MNNLSDIFTVYEGLKVPEAEFIKPAISTDYLKALEDLKKRLENTQKEVADPETVKVEESSDFVNGLDFYGKNPLFDASYWDLSSYDIAKTPSEFLNVGGLLELDMTPMYINSAQTTDNGWRLNSTPSWTLNYVSGVAKALKDNKVRFTDFMRKFTPWADAHNVDPTTRNILISIAGLESGYQKTIANPTSSAYGYFLFIRSTADGINPNIDYNNSEEQFQLALEHYNKCKEELRPYINQIKKYNLTPLLAIYGMWWRPESMKNFLNTGSDDYVDKQGTTLLKIFEKAR